MVELGNWPDLVLRTANLSSAHHTAYMMQQGEPTSFRGVENDKSDYPKLVGWLLYLSDPRRSVGRFSHLFYGVPFFLRSRVKCNMTFLLLFLLGLAASLCPDDDDCQKPITNNADQRRISAVQ